MSGLSAVSSLTRSIITKLRFGQSSHNFDRNANHSSARTNRTEVPTVNANSSQVPIGKLVECIIPSQVDVRPELLEHQKVYLALKGLGPNLIAYKNTALSDENNEKAIPELTNAFKFLLKEIKEMGTDKVFDYCLNYYGLYSTSWGINNNKLFNAKITIKRTLSQKHVSFYKLHNKLIEGIVDSLDPLPMFQRYLIASMISGLLITCFISDAEKLAISRREVNTIFKKIWGF